MYAEFRDLTSYGILELILQDLIYKNFLQANNAQKEIWSSLLNRFTQGYFKEIYLVIFRVLFHFLQILEV
jgi:hypothetical protein